MTPFHRSLAASPDGAKTLCTRVSSSPEAAQFSSPRWPEHRASATAPSLAKPACGFELEFGDSEPDMTSTLREELVGHLTRGEILLDISP